MFTLHCLEFASTTEPVFFFQFEGNLTIRGENLLCVGNNINRFPSVCLTGGHAKSIFANYTNKNNLIKRLTIILLFIIRVRNAYNVVPPQTGNSFTSRISALDKNNKLNTFFPEQMNALYA